MDTLGHIGTNDTVTDIALSQLTNLIHSGNMNDASFACRKLMDM